MEKSKWKALDQRFNRRFMSLRDLTEKPGKIIPIYPLTYKLSQNVLRKIIENGVDDVYGKLSETLPDYIMKKYKLEDINTAIKQIHFPDNFSEFDKVLRAPFLLSVVT